MTPFEYASVAQNMVKMLAQHMARNMTRNNTAVPMFVRGSSGSLREYLYHIGIQNATLLSHRMDMMIVSCYFYFVQGTLGTHMPCSDLGYLKPVFDPFNSNCVTIQFDREAMSKSNSLDSTAELIPRVQGVEVVMYLDNHRRSILEPYESPELLTGNTEGAMVTVHAHNTVPDTGSTIFLMRPGFSYYFVPRVSLRKRLEPPHGTCQQGIEHRRHIWSLDKQKANYSYSTCGFANMQKFLYEKCGCIVPSYQV